MVQDYDVFIDKCEYLYHELFGKRMTPHVHLFVNAIWIMFFEEVNE